jgi:hypothetical protein
VQRAGLAHVIVRPSTSATCAEFTIFLRSQNARVFRSAKAQIDRTKPGRRLKLTRGTRPEAGRWFSSTLEDRTMTFATSKAAVAITTALLAGSFGAASAYPILDAVQGLPNPELITVYPDDADKNLYYFVPTSVALVRDENDRPRLGVQYWGLTGLDPEGAGAALTFSVKPAYDKKLADAVAEAVRKKNPNATFAFPTLVDSTMEVLLNGQFHKKNQDTEKPAVKGGTVDATQAFTVSLSNIGGRAFAQGVAADSDVLGARYTFKFTGVEKRLRAEIIVHHKRIYDHFKYTASASGWWGMVRTSWSVDWQKLVSDGAIVVNILEGGETEKDAYMLEVFKHLVEAKIGEKGMFEPKLKPGGIVGAPEAQKWGWGFAGGGGWEHLEEHVNFKFQINTQKLADREFSVGLSFAAVCARHPDSFADLTLLGNKCINKIEFEKTAKALRKCVDAKLDRLLKLKNEGKITEAIWEKQVNKALDDVCIPEEQQIARLAQAVSAATADNLENRALSVDASNSVRSSTDCLRDRLSHLKLLVDAGRITMEAWERSAASAFDVPCRARPNGNAHKIF